MTKTEHNTLQNFINKIQEYNNIADECFKSLQDMCRDKGLTVCCSAIVNYKQLIGTDLETRAEMLYNEYLGYRSKADTITDLGSELARLNFWK